jgi:apolipoprotein N-acyltransferase
MVTTAENNLRRRDKSLPMTPNPDQKPRPTLGVSHGLILALVALAAFHLAYSIRGCGFLISVFLACLFALSRLPTGRQAFYAGMAIGVAAYAPHLSFFWVVFGPAAMALWLVLAFWIAMFLALGRACRVRLGPIWAAVLAPVLWMGLEYFRSELYWLKFSWLNVGYAFTDSPQLHVIGTLGMYGIGFLLMGVASALTFLPRTVAAAVAGTLLAALGLWTNLPARATPPTPTAVFSVKVAAVQMEFPGELQTIQSLDKLGETYPESQLMVLSEYTLDGPVSKRLQEWCRKNSKHLVVGGKDEVQGRQFYNTAFVVGPQGKVVFQQAKAMPIQFFNDGLPAKEQRVWDSPWGRLGLAICYDLSYTRVTDRLVRLGAQALIIPTMDVATWGAAEHRLHGRVALMRAAEYGVPIFRVASSGISQLVDARGTVVATAPFPGEKARLGGDLALVRAGRLPLDRWMALPSTVLTGLLGVGLALSHLRACLESNSRRREALSKARGDDRKVGNLRRLLGVRGLEIRDTADWKSALRKPRRPPSEFTARGFCSSMTV